MTRWLPYPLLTASLLLMWLLLNRFSLGHLLLGAIVAVVASRAMGALRKEPPKAVRWTHLPRLAGLVITDIVRSNFAVAAIIVAGRRGQRVSGFVEISLRLKGEVPLALLACIITSTPGTTWVNFDPNNGRLTLHVLDLVDEATWVALIRDRYEALLMEIFP
jgi:multicomponent K+:H+ antiporter subunit E